MKDIETMLPSELRVKEIELTAIVANTKAAKELKAIQKEITNRKKFGGPKLSRLLSLLEKSLDNSKLSSILQSVGSMRLKSRLPKQ